MKLVPTVAAALSLACLFLLLPPADVSAAQSRQRRNTTARQPATARGKKPVATASASTLNAARIRLADELKTLTRFLYVYGRASIGVENTEKQARESGAQVSPEAQAILNRSQASMQKSVGDIRDRLDKLELYFRTTPGLEQHYTRLSGVAATATAAAQRAGAGQLDAAGRSLIEVANQLADVLLDM